MMGFFRDAIDAMDGYVPGEQPKPGERVIKLNTNENPYPPSPRAMDALRNLDADALRRYPDPFAAEVRRAVADVLDVPAEWVLVGNGSDDLLTMLLRACCEPGRPAAFPMPTYVLYRTLANIQHAECIEVPFDEEYRLPIESLIKANAPLTLLARPNSPSGTTWDIDRLTALADGLAGLLVVDEAYADFAADNALKLVRQKPNVVVLRTLSKGYSLAGLRLGFGIAHPDVLAGLAKVKDSYNVDAVSAVVGAEAIRDQDHLRGNVDRVRASRAMVTGGLERLGWRVWPSEANFLLARPPRGDGEDVYRSLKKQGILVRYFNQPGLADKVRITIGTDQQCRALLNALDNPSEGTA